MKTPITHTVCGGQLGWYEKTSYQAIPRSADFERMDGTHPDPGTLFEETCPACNEIVYGFKDVDGFDTTTTPIVPAYIAGLDGLDYEPARKEPGTVGTLRFWQLFRVISWGIFKREKFYHFGRLCVKMDAADAYRRVVE